MSAPQLRAQRQLLCKASRHLSKTRRQLLCKTSKQLSSAGEVALQPPAPHAHTCPACPRPSPTFFFFFFSAPSASSPPSPWCFLCCTASNRGREEAWRHMQGGPAPLARPRRSRTDAPESALAAGRYFSEPSEPCTSLPQASHLLLLLLRLLGLAALLGRRLRRLRRRGLGRGGGGGRGRRRRGRGVLLAVLRGVLGGEGRLLLRAQLLPLGGCGAGRGGAGRGGAGAAGRVDSLRVQAWCGNVAPGALCNACSWGCSTPCSNSTRRRPACRPGYSPGQPAPQPRPARSPAQPAPQPRPPRAPAAEKSALCADGSLPSAASRALISASLSFTNWL